ncbi:MAG TPA: cryptochrome/photolyase family protein [Planctomycetota bacterium]|nr:cryptochrome/photolyase family protein [Planctomycetota bacterium]HRR82429.1 cryptochrome/photolyase family protein [Planctomycetota bacterium]HRT95699.1 cryptochrome/photolyase family protein [Planctomycetota bacterium]
MRPTPRQVRALVLVLGDQLDASSAAFDGFDAAADVVWMAEVGEEAAYVWSHRARIALFLAAMRHFRDALRDRGVAVDYHALDDGAERSGLAAELAEAVRRLKPQRLIVVEPGEWRVKQALTAAAKSLALPLEVRPDRHFLCSHGEFAAHAEGRRRLRLEYFYRQMRRRLGLLVEGRRPIGGQWNYDAANRRSFGKEGPGELPRPLGFPADRVTREAIRLVEQRFVNHPGSLAHFDWPVTPADARRALDDFVENRLAQFGPYEDAMWTGQPWVYHSRLSAPVNLKLLDPRDAVAAVETAYQDGHAPLQSAEAVIRQFIGWREFIRGVYWRCMPDYQESNALGADAPLPWFYWTGETEMACLREVVGQTLALGFAHHIQRLMVAGLFAQLLGVHPFEVHKWFLAVYVDAVDWVTLPNVLGMSQFADGGVMSSKPYVATGRYIQRMSNYCLGCRFDPARPLGHHACPFTTLYWDFLARHEKRLRANRRMGFQVRNLDRLSRDDRAAIRRQAGALRDVLAAEVRRYGR